MPKTSEQCNVDQIKNRCIDYRLSPTMLNIQDVWMLNVTYLDLESADRALESNLETIFFRHTKVSSFQLPTFVLTGYNYPLLVKTFKELATPRMVRGTRLKPSVLLPNYLTVYSKRFKLSNLITLLSASTWVVSKYGSMPYPTSKLWHIDRPIQVLKCMLGRVAVLLLLAYSTSVEISSSLFLLLYSYVVVR